VTCVCSARVSGTRWMWFGLWFAGCAPDDQLDTDSPWPADGGAIPPDDPEDRGASGGVTAEQGEVGPMVALVSDGGVEIQTVMEASVEDGEVIVTHLGVELSPCDDIEVALMVWDELQVVSGAFVANDCDAESGFFDIEWRFPAPTRVGEWRLQLGADVANFTIE